MSVTVTKPNKKQLDEAVAKMKAAAEKFKELVKKN